MRAIQTTLPGIKTNKKEEFGGSLLKGNPRDPRPVSLKRPMHLVMRSTLATKEKSFLHRNRAQRIQQLVYRTGKSKGVKVYRFANSGNHLHLVILPRSHRSYRAFIRSIVGLIARITLGAQRGSALQKRFWDARPFSRLLKWGRDFRIVSTYVTQNTLEALGFISYQPRKRRVSSRHRPP